MYKLKSILPVVAFLLLLGIITIKSEEKDCKDKETCGKCIQTPGCKWCSDPNYSNYRCFFTDVKRTCSNISNPESSTTPTIENTQQGTSKIEPKIAKVKLRVGDKINITMRYTDENSRPLELYILMDNSCTMKKHKTEVVELTGQLVDGLRNLTSELQLGFGTFVDKPVSPYALASSITTTTTSKCDGQPVQSAYAFKNHLHLTKNSTLFQDEVNKTMTSTNIDSPEGGLEALMQTVVCKDKIGWRVDTETRSRRLVVLSTDDRYHLAGDGKLGGIVIPNDGECHLDANGDYTKATTQDYPSISQLRDKIIENDIYVIFAVTRNVLRIYEKLAKQFEPRATAKSITETKTSNTSSSIVDVIRKEYAELVSSVTLQNRNPSELFEVKYYAKCTDNGDFVEKKTCSGLKPGANITFQVEVQLKNCSAAGNNEIKNIKIGPTLGTEFMNIEVETLCSCQCEADDNKTKLGEEMCSSNGFLQCGICACEESWGGQFCNCSTTNGQSILQETCIDSTGNVCGNRYPLAHNLLFEY